MYRKEMYVAQKKYLTHKIEIYVEQNKYLTHKKEIYVAQKKYLTRKLRGGTCVGACALGSA